MGFFTLFKGSFHSAALYRQVRVSGRTYLGYAFMLVALNALLVSLFVGFVFYQLVFSARGDKPPLLDDVVTQVAQQIPVMTLKDDMLMTRDPAPTTIYLDVSIGNQTFTQKPVATIDTSGQTTYDTMTTPILISAKEVIIKTNDKTEIKPIREFVPNAPPTLLINQALMEDMAKQLLRYIHDNLLLIFLVIGLFAWAMFTALMIVLRLTMLLLLGLVGLLIGAITDTPIPYTTAVGLAAISYTPVAVLDALLFALVSYPASGMTLLLAGSVALFAAIRVTQSASNTMVG